MAYDDSNWMQILKGLNLSESDYDKARILLARKDAGFRQGMLGDNADSNKRVILMTLGESLLPLGYMGLLGGNWELYRVLLPGLHAPCSPPSR